MIKYSTIEKEGIVVYEITTEQFCETLQPD